MMLSYRKFELDNYQLNIKLFISVLMLVTIAAIILYFFLTMINYERIARFALILPYIISLYVYTFELWRVNDFSLSDWLIKSQRKI